MPHLPQSEPAAIGLDGERLQAAYQLLDHWTQDGSVPGGAILVGRHGKTVAPHFSGK